MKSPAGLGHALNTCLLYSKVIPLRSFLVYSTVSEFECYLFSLKQTRQYLPAQKVVKRVTYIFRVLCKHYLKFCVGFQSS